MVGQLSSAGLSCSHVLAGHGRDCPGGIQELLSRNFTGATAAAPAGRIAAEMEPGLKIALRVHLIASDVMGRETDAAGKYFP